MGRTRLCQTSPRFRAPVRPWFALLYLALAIVSFRMWDQTSDLWWTLGAAGFALASIRETLLYLKEMNRQ
jgi:hypothetical protein